MEYISRDNKFFRKARLNYQRMPDRPLLVRDHRNNWILLEEDLQITWNSWKSHLQECISEGKWNIVRHFLKCDMTEVELRFPISETHFNQNISLIREFINQGAHVSLNTRSIETLTFPHLIEVLTILKSQGESIRGYSDSELVHYLAKLMKVKSNGVYRERIPMRDTVDQFLRASDDEKNRLLKEYIYHSNYKIIGLIIASGYVPNPMIISNTYCLVHILEILPCSEEIKLQLLRDCVNNLRADITSTYRSTNLGYIINHPSSAGLWSGLPSEVTDPLERIWASRRLNLAREWSDSKGFYLMNSHDPFFLDYLPSGYLDETIRKKMLHQNNYGGSFDLMKQVTSPKFRKTMIDGLAQWGEGSYLMNAFKDHWSVIPTDNEDLLEYLDAMGIELPPPLKDGDYSIIRISQSSNKRDIVGRLLDACDRDNRAAATLLKLLDGGIIILSDYRDHPMTELIMKCIPVINLKGAHTK